MEPKLTPEAVARIRAKVNRVFAEQLSEVQNAQQRYVANFEAAELANLKQTVKNLEQLVEDLQSSYESEIAKLSSGEEK